MVRSINVLGMFLLVFVQKSKACDVCGSSVGGIGVGLMDTYQNYFGFQYQYAPFHATQEHAQDYFHTLELALRLRVLDRINLQLNHPYRVNNRQSPDGNATHKGLGDTRLVASYILLDQVALGKRLKLYADAGCGVKLPTGSYDPNLHERQNLPENFNIGNGSWAGLLQTNLVLTYKTVGLAVSGMYQHNGPARSGGYRFGHQWSCKLLLFKQFPVGSHLVLTPFGGLAAEQVGRDEKADGKYAPSTGGQGYFGAAGLNLKLDNWLLGATYSQPFSQHYSNAEVEAKGRLNLQLSHIF